MTEDAHCWSSGKKQQKTRARFPLSSCREPSTLRGKIRCSAHVERTDPARVTSAWGWCVVVAIHTNPKGLSDGAWLWRYTPTPSAWRWCVVVAIRTNPKGLSSCREPSTLRGKIRCSAHVERTDPARVTSAWGWCLFCRPTAYLCVLFAPATFLFPC